jgi:hypothetical protein
MDVYVRGHIQGMNRCAPFQIDDVAYTLRMSRAELRDGLQVHRTEEVIAARTS